VVGKGFNVFQYDPAKGKYWKKFLAERATHQECVEYIQKRVRDEKALEERLAREDKVNEEKFIKALEASPWVFQNAHVFHEDDPHQR